MNLLGRLDRLHRHAAFVLARRDRAMLQNLDDNEIERLKLRRFAYACKVAEEVDFIHKRLDAQAGHADRQKARVESKRRPQKRQFRGPMR